MTVPSIVRVLPYGADITDPVEGPTGGGQLVEVYGDGFLLPDTTPVAVVTGGVVIAPVPRTVSVTFGGVEAQDVAVVASNLLRVVTPPSAIPVTAAGGHGAGAVDVVITNLDVNEDPIAGETATLAGGYTYRHTQLDASTENDFTRVVRALIDELKRRVLPNTVYSVDTDWDSDTSTAFVDVAELPALVLQGPETSENRFYSLNARQYTDDENGVPQLNRKVHTLDLRFDIVGITDHPVQALNLLALCTRFVEDMPFLTVARDPDDASKGSVGYEFDFDAQTGFQVSTNPNDSNLHTFSGSVIVRGVDVEGLAGFPRSAVVGVGAYVSDDGVELLDTESFGG